MKDSEMIAQIRQGNHNVVLKQLYKEFPKVKTNILKNGGSAEIAQEIFNDSLLLLVEKVTVPSFELTASLSTYLYGIARFRWMNEARKHQKYQQNEWKNTMLFTEEDLAYDEEKELKLQAVEQVLETITQKCRQLFEFFYFQKLSMKVIAEKLQFSSVNSAKTQKYKCLEKAIQLANNL